MKSVVKSVAVAISMASLSHALCNGVPNTGCDGTGRISFVPIKCAVGQWGDRSSRLNGFPSEFYWVLKDDKTSYNLGRLDDVAARSRYATCLSAQAQGRSVSLGIWALTGGQINAGDRHDELPESFYID